VSPAAQNVTYFEYVTGASAVNAAAENLDENAFQASALLRTLVLCDLVDSTALVERLGDRVAAELIRKHDRLARTIADRHGGKEIDKTDGFLMLFERPIQAVGFALEYQRGLKQLNAAEHSNLSARVGIHVGDVVVWDNTPDDIARGAKPVEVEGLVKPITSRLMSLALPGQILLSNIAYALAHRAQGELGQQLEKVRWRTHGRYRFRGIPDPVPVFEVGEEGLAPLKAPPWSSKAHREVPFWRRPATVAIEAFLLAALIAIPIYMFARPEPAIAFANRDWVVVGNLNNLTGETVFDDALESALRIGLEQSRYVNVLPDLKVRDTVKRMERDPDNTRIDRAIGSEVALRDGARALILPTIAEVGGRVRLTAEVIDPHTQATVYSETADGVGAESVLPSLDTINNRLRVRLGEALAAVSADSLPLEKVATKNLDALRAYSLGYKNFARGSFGEAISLYEQALQLDPGFAAVNVRMAHLFVSSGRSAETKEQLEKALSKRDRLTQRDILYAEALAAQLDSPKASLAKWRALADSFPDFFAGTAAYAYFSWLSANRFDKEIVDFAKRAASTQNPNRAAALHFLGILALGNERYADAEAHFADAETLVVERTEYHAAAYAAQRNFALAEKTMAQSRDHENQPNVSVIATRNAFAASFALDQGRHAEATNILSKAKERARKIPTLDGMFELIELSVASPTGATERAGALSDLLQRAVSLRKIIPSAEQSEIDARILFISYLAARDGNAKLAKEALSHVDVVRRDAEFPLLQNLAQVANAQILLIEGRAADAVALLNRSKDGTELYVTHIALLDAHLSIRDTRAADAEARWLIKSRGRAYAEHNANKLLTAFNVLHANLALLSAAETALALGNKDRARADLTQLQTAWPDADKAPDLKSQLDQLRSALEKH
jgi:putative peptide modification system cyclase